MTGAGRQTVTPCIACGDAGRHRIGDVRSIGTGKERRSKTRSRAASRG